MIRGTVLWLSCRPCGCILGKPSVVEDGRGASHAKRSPGWELALPLLLEDVMDGIWTDTGLEIGDSRIRKKGEKQDWIF